MNPLKSCLLIFLLSACQSALSQSNAQRLDVVCWNVEWFGAASQTPADDNLQQANVIRTLRYLDADIYGLTEIVDTGRLRRVTDSLGAQFAYVISPFGSGNSTGTGTSWLNAQKLAFIYNKTMFSNVTARGLMRNSGPAYTAFASGRFPFMLSADVSLNNVTRRINFILIHGKAGSTASDYDRRSEGARELKDTLDTYHSNALNLIFGDFNDALNTTICNNCQSQASSYDVIVRDSVDENHYKSITLPLALAGETTMTNFPNVIDNQVVSDELFPMYVNGSAAIRKEVAQLIPNYGFTTSDHYPVSAQFILTGAITSLPSLPPAALGLQLMANPVNGAVSVRAGQRQGAVSFHIYDAAGRLIGSYRFEQLTAGQTISLPLPGKTSGMLFLRATTTKGTTDWKLIQQ